MRNRADKKRIERKEPCIIRVDSYQHLKTFFHLFSGQSPNKTPLPSGTSLHEHDELGLCTIPDPTRRLEKRSYLPPISCTDTHEISAVQAKVHCQPRPRVVQLPWPNDTSVHQVRKKDAGLQSQLRTYVFLVKESPAWGTQLDELIRKWYNLATRVAKTFV